MISMRVNPASTSSMGDGRSPLERLNKVVKRRLKGFEISFPGKGLGKVRLKAWKAYHNLGLKLEGQPR